MEIKGNVYVEIINCSVQKVVKLKYQDTESRVKNYNFVTNLFYRLLTL